MRAKILLGFVAAMGVAIGWFAERTTAASRHAQLDALRLAHRELLALQHEHARLAAHQPDPARMAQIWSTLATRRRAPRDEGSPISASRPEAFPIGEWSSCQTWRNSGGATPRAALETALWAAAGGDVSTLTALLEFEPVALAKATELLAKLPASSRLLYATPEALVASSTIRKIPLAEAQLVWFHQVDPDHAAVGVILNQAEENASPAPADVTPLPGSPPPMLRDSGKRTLATLALHRSGSAWRLVVPAGAIDRLSGELLNAEP